MQEGVRAGVSLSDARAALPGLLTHPCKSAADLPRLRQLARWCGRYGPNRNALVIRSGLASPSTSVSGSTLPASSISLAERMSCSWTSSCGWLGRIYVPDRACRQLWRCACLGPVRHCAGRHLRCQPGHARRMLEALPVESLRLAPHTVVLLRRLGLYSIGQLYGLPRTSLARRFRDDRVSRSMSDAVAQAQAVLIRLDQALGLLAEPLRPLGEPPVLSVRKTFPEILITSAGLRSEVEHLLAELCRDLEASALGARRVRVLLTRVDGTVGQVLAGTSAACRTPAHLLRLMSDRLDAIDAGFGIDALVLEALRVERLSADQGEIEGAMGSVRESPALLLDRPDQSL